MYRFCRPLALAGLLAFGMALTAQKAPEKQPPAATGPTSVSEVGGKTLKEWMAELKSIDPGVRGNAILNIILFGDQAADALPLIIDKCSDPDAGPRAKAVIALKIMTIRERDVLKVVDALARRLSQDAQGVIRYEAALALNRYATEAHSAVLALCKGVADPATYEIRQASIIALRRAGIDPKTGPDPRATNALLQALHDPVEKVRLEATISLGAMGRPSDPLLLQQVVTALQKLLTSRDKYIALWAHVALFALDDKVSDKSLQAIVKLTQNNDRDMRYQALMAIAAIGSKARLYLPDVLLCLDDRETMVISGACATLARMEDHGPKVIEALVKVTKRKEPALVYAACQALVDLGAPLAEINEALSQVLQRKELDDAVLQAVRRLQDQLKRGKDKK